MESELKPCPWCQKPPVSGDSSYGYWRVFCPETNECLVSPICDCDTETEAIAAWNQRAAPPAQDTAQSCPTCGKDANEFCSDAFHAPAGAKIYWPTQSGEVSDDGVAILYTTISDDPLFVEVDGAAGVSLGALKRLLGWKIDLTERLLGWAKDAQLGRKMLGAAQDLKEAAVEITRLTAALEKAEAKNAVAEKMAGALRLHNNAYGPNTGAQKLLVEVLNEWKGLTDGE